MEPVHSTWQRKVVSMAYNVVLELRIRSALGNLPHLTEKKMFGGVGFMVQGNMACGVHKDNMIVRVGPDRHVESLAKPYVKPFDLTGKSMAGWVQVLEPGYESDDELKEWVKKGVEFALSLPAK